MSTFVEAVTLLPFAPSGRLFLLRELKDKGEIEKRAGMISFPFETVELKEAISHAVCRLIHEEIGDCAFLKLKPKFFGEFLVSFSSGIVGHIFAHYSECADEFIGCPTDNDIEYYGWRFPRELLRMEPSARRKEVVPVLSGFLNRRIIFS